MNIKNIYRNIEKPQNTNNKLQTILKSCLPTGRIFKITTLCHSDPPAGGQNPPRKTHSKRHGILNQVQKEVNCEAREAALGYDTLKNKEKELIK